MDSKGPINRRSFLRAVVGTAALGGSTAMVSGCATLANSDSDPFDPIGGGYGRRNGYPDQYEQCTDSDRGSQSDPRGRGRNCSGQQQACSDNDSGQYQDPAGRGRRCSGAAPRPQACSDNDSGRYQDPAGQGRRCGTSQPRTCSDSDSGQYQDPGGRGRRC